MLKNTLANLYYAVVAGKQKALVGGFAAGALSLLALVGISGEMTVKEALIALGNWVVTHYLVHQTTNKV